MELNEFKSFVEKGLEGVRGTTQDAIQETRNELKARYDELKAQGANVDDLRKEMDRAMKRMDMVEANMSRPDYAPPQEKSLGHLIMEAEATKELARATSAGGSYTRGTRATLPMKSFFLDTEKKTTITSATVGSSTPGILLPERIPGVVRPGFRRIRVRDLMPRLTTQNNAVEWVKWNVTTNAASPTAETISKPESAQTFTIDSATVKTIAHWIPLAKQVLDDFVQLRAEVDISLLEGLKDVEDYELVAGDGTGNHLSGLSTEATAYDTARNAASDTYIDKLNHAISQVEDVNHAADGIILHPRDWRALQLVKTEEGGANKGMYLLGGPSGDAMPMIWGLPVATTPAVTRGTFYVGAFQQFTAIYDRMTALVELSTEHDNFWIRNMVAVRAEERITFVVKRADAVIYGAF